MLKKKLLILMLTAAMTVSVFAGCGETTEQQPVEKTTGLSTNELQDGAIYVRHSDETFDKLYTPDDNQTTENLYWFKNDKGFNKIPTVFLGKGDELIYYSTANFQSSFKFTRYYDLGYSVGIRALSLTNNGRYTLSTNVDDKTTYPGSDCDDILDLGGDDKQVVVDSISGQLLRGKESGSGYVNSDFVTQWQTVKGLQKDAYYDFYIYRGTVRKVVKLKANVHILGMAEESNSEDYLYDKQNTKIIELGIPTYLNDGYYNINDQGLVRLINGDKYDETMSINTPNEVPENKRTSVTGEDSDYGDGVNSDDAAGEKTTDFAPESSGKATLKITFSTDDFDQLDNFLAYILMPDDSEVTFANDPDAENNTIAYKAEIDVEKGQTYRIFYSGISGDAVPNISYDIKEKKEPEAKTEKKKSGKKKSNKKKSTKDNKKKKKEDK